MAGKLKSTIRRIPWSLLLRATLFALVWFVGPFWAFVLLGVGFYFFPFFQPKKFLLPFVLILFLGYLLPETFWAALFLGTLFFLMLGMKDLLLIRRASAHELLVFLLLFLLLFAFYTRFEGPGLAALFASAGIHLVLFFLLRGLIRSEPVPESRGGTREELIRGLVVFLLWQMSFVLMFLPLNFLSQIALHFLMSVIFIELFLEYSTNRLLRRKILTSVSISFVLLTFILISNQWGL